jgi:hypothetical protein
MRQFETDIYTKLIRLDITVFLRIFFTYGFTVGSAVGGSVSKVGFKVGYAVLQDRKVCHIKKMVRMRQFEEKKFFHMRVL